MKSVKLYFFNSAFLFSLLLFPLLLSFFPFHFSFLIYSCIFASERARFGMAETTKQEQWQWQEEGTSWRGIGIYHVTLTVPSREALLGTLVIPNSNPAEARVEPTEFGRALLACQRSVPIFHPEIQILQYCLMPDHLHSIWYVRRPMKESIRYVVQGFWRAAKKVGRAYSYINHARGL